MTNGAFSKRDVRTGAGFWRALEVCRAPLFLFAIAFGVRLAIILATHSYQHVERAEVFWVASSLAQHGTFADAYGPGTGFTAHLSPAYPILLSLVYRIFGTGVGGDVAQEVLSSMFASLTYATLPLLSVSFGVSREVGALAGFIGGLFPVNFWAETKGSAEYALAGFILVLFCVFIARAWYFTDFSLKSALLTGLVSGLALLVSGGFSSIVLSTLCIGLWLFSKSSARRYFIWALIVLLATTLCLAPWALRNRLKLGGYVWLRSNFGLELFISNNDAAVANLDDNFASGWFQKSHPYPSAVERAIVAQVGELAYEHQKLQQALHWISIHPLRFTILSLQRLFYFWFPRMRRWPQSFLMGIFSIGAFVGSIQLLRRGNASGWLCFGILTAYPLIYYFVESSARYRGPLDALLVFLTIYGIMSMFCRVGALKALQVQRQKQALS
jgi:hypothetical protein